MSANRFRAGDVVVLNGHRLTVESLGSNLRTGEPRVRLTAESGAPSQVMPADWLPDPEPHEEPEPDYPPGSVWQDADGDVYQRTPDGEWLRTGVLRTYRHASPNRPLTRLVPETAVPDDARDSWDTFGTKRGVVMADTAGTTQYMPDPYVCQRPVPDGGLADNGMRCGRRNPCPDHAGTYDDSEGDLEALARSVPALTPGQPVAHKDGRLGIYVGQPGPVATWRPFDSGDLFAVDATDLRPVTLVERPDRQTTVARLVNHLVAGRESGMRAEPNAELIYDDLFGEPS